jgi:hypothetical protein
MRAAILTPLAFGWLALGAGLALAQDVELPPAVVSAFDACTEPGRNASERFTVLADAGWRVAPDDAVPTAFAALAEAERFGFLEPGTPEYAEFIAGFDVRLRNAKDAGLPAETTLTVAAIQPVLAAQVMASVQMSVPDYSAHLTVRPLGNGIDRMSMECSLLLTTPVDDATRMRLSASRGFDESHGYMPPPKAGKTSVIYKRVGDSGPEDPWTVGFESFAPDSTLAQMATDLDQPVTILGIITTRSRHFSTI